MQWSPQQERALFDIARWLKTPVEEEPVYKLFGYAGTGKTTLACHVVEEEDCIPKYAAYTGKAAEVMRRSGCVGATTIHKLIYRMKPKSKAGLQEMEANLAKMHAARQVAATPALLDQIADLEEKAEAEKDSLRRPGFQVKEGPTSWADKETGEQMSDYDDGPWGADLIVLDECSMIDMQMAKDLLSFKKKILVLGDPAQLPPIASTGYFIQGDPNTMLTEIHRQAKDNPIIAMATIVREGGSLALGSYGDSEVVLRANSDPSRYIAADQLLVGMNATRRAFNKRMRERRGAMSPLPEEGEKLICLRNNHKLALLNGSLWQVEEAIPCANGGRVMLSLKSLDEESGRTIHTEAWSSYFLGSEPDYFDVMDYDSFDYGYAVTVHKFQGSQADDIVLMDEWKRANRKEWLYTGLTRAAKRITVVK